MLSNTAEYALRAVLYLAEHDTGEPVRVDVVAEALEVPRNYLSKTLHLLAKRGVLSSMRGPKGGYYLAVPAGALSILEVVDPFDAIGERRSCLLGQSKCSDDAPCSAHARWKQVAEQIAAFFRETTVAELLDDPEQRAAVAAAAAGR